MSRYKYFELFEFDSPDDPGSGRHMDPVLLDKLDFMREYCGFPFIVTSGVRTKEHNINKGGAENSDHLIKSDGLSHGADIAYEGSRQRYLILAAAFKYGIRRIGIGKDFIHLGNWYQNDQDVTWLY